MRLNIRDSGQLTYQSAFGSKKVFIDKTNKQIVLRNRYFLIIHRKRVIPFAAISNVMVDYNVYLDRNDQYELSIVVDNKKVTIDETEAQWEMWSLGHLISQLTGKEMVDRSSSKSEAIFSPNISREEIVERWKKRAEQEAKMRRHKGKEKRH